MAGVYRPRHPEALLVRKELLSPGWAEDWGASSMPGRGIQRQGREFNMPWKKNAYPFEEERSPCHAMCEKVDKYI